MKLPVISDGQSRLAILAQEGEEMASLDLRTGKVAIESMAYVPINFIEEREIELPKFNGTVYLDVDDILLDFHAYLNDFVARNYELHFPLGFKPSQYDYSDVLKNHKDGSLTIGQIFADMGITWPKHLRPLRHASLFTHALKALGARIVLITSVSMEQLPVRIANLAENDIVFDELYPSKGIKKSSIVNAFGFRVTSDDVFIDDMMANCFDVGANSTGITILTLNTPYNETFVKANGELAYTALRSRIESYSFVQDIYTATLEHVSAAVLKSKGLESYAKEKSPIDIKVNGASIDFPAPTKPAFGCGSDNACPTCPSRTGATAR